jgi:hypothetical protein
MEIGDIIKKYLKDNGFSGLYSPAADCGCDMEDLFACGEDCTGCEPGYKIEDPTGEHNYLITTKKSIKRR